MTFQPIQQFSDDDAGDLDRMNQLISNQQHLFDESVDYKYSAYGVGKTEGMKVAVGVVNVGGSNTKYRTRWIGTGDFFTPGSRPVAVATPASLTKPHMWCTIAHRTRNGVNLDHTGFSIHVRLLEGTGNLGGSHKVNWIAIGW